jgi:hypothetical protein
LFLGSNHNEDSKPTIKETFPSVGKLLRLGEAGLVHVLCLDVVIEELHPLGGHLVVELNFSTPFPLFLDGRLLAAGRFLIVQNPS